MYIYIDGTGATLPKIISLNATGSEGRPENRRLPQTRQVCGIHTSLNTADYRRLNTSAVFILS